MSRTLKIRVCEHRKISFRTNEQLFNPSYRIITEHSLQSDHCYKEEDFTIVHRARNTTELRLAASLFIHKNKPSLNNIESATTSNVFP